MPAESLKQRVSALEPHKDTENLRILLQANLDALQALASKLDADATVTDTNYRATVDALITD